MSKKTTDKTNQKHPKFYCLDMFPYPSGNALHVGHPKGYVATDIYTRYKKMKGFNVLHPFGWDAFGLPAENHAIKNNIHPSVAVEKNIERFKNQLKMIDLEYDWDREVNTTDPDYYKWTQWIFLQLFKHGLAYKQEIPINFCPSCKIGLANEEVVNGKCERCKTKVERKKLSQWMLKITEYADRLLDGLKDLDWPKPIIEMQKNWIGKSKGTNIYFDVITNSTPVIPAKAEIYKNSNSVLPASTVGRDPRVKPEDDNLSINVFTTRVDTLFGCTYVILAPEHELVQQLKPQIKNWDKVEKYLVNAQNKSDLERTELQKEKTGIKLEGIKAINPINGKEVDVWVADYVLANYGTGAVMAVPAHDERDFEFAKKYGIEIIDVIIPDITYDKNPPKNNDKFIVRNCIEAIIYDPKKDKYLVLEWKRQPWTTFITGGIEKGEDIIEAAKREVIEETGFKNIKFIKKLGSPVISKFFAAHKNEDRKAYFNGILFELVNDERNEISKDEKDSYDINWLSKDEITYEKMACAALPHWLERLENGEASFIDFGELINSKEFNGLDSKTAIKKITEKLKEMGKGDFETNYKLRDWIFSRQHYWGEPIPIIHCKKCGIVPLNEKDLPLELPKVKNYKPTNTGESPLANESDPIIKEWLNTKCPKCGGNAIRETDTMPNWAGSSWYYLRYIDPKNNKELVDPEKEKYWMQPKGVDLYVGGAEHAVLHLLYARFWHKFLFDIKKVSTQEPFHKLINVGLILMPDGGKMSKSEGKTINPDGLVKKYGSDAFRLTEMFLGPFRKTAIWNTNGIIGMKRFLDRIEKVIDNILKSKEGFIEGYSGNRLRQNILNKTIKKINSDIENFEFNISIALLMELFNFDDDLPNVINDIEKSYRWKYIDDISIFLKLLYPFAPKTTQELWKKIGNKDEISDEKFPEFKGKVSLIKSNVIVQINSKVRSKFETEVKDENKIIEIAKSDTKIQKLIKNQKIIKEIIIYNNPQNSYLINIVVK